MTKAFGNTVKDLGAMLSTDLPLDQPLAIGTRAVSVNADGLRTRVYWDGSAWQSEDAIVVSASAPSDSDGRPNGTIYIQSAS